MMSDNEERLIVFDNVSKFYGEVLGVNRLSLSLSPGITGLVGPNGSGKTTFMNLMTGLLKPTRGKIRILGLKPNQTERLFRKLGYCAQFDSFPRGFTGYQFIEYFLRVHGFSSEEAHRKAWQALEKVKLTEAADRLVAAYSKGMRQRIKLAQAISHDPPVLVLDEPLNGLDPMARAETIALFREFAGEGRHVIISSHILHEVDMISDRVVLINGGYVVAEGDIQSVRSEMPEHPIQILVRCDQPALLASRLFEMDHIVEVKIQEDRKGLLIRTRNADQFYLRLNMAILESQLEVETVTPADEDVHSVYRYLIGSDGGSN
jgi:ABC-2 type transport system ATP-binding protein